MLFRSQNQLAEIVQWRWLKSLIDKPNLLRRRYRNVLAILSNELDHVGLARWTDDRHFLAIDAFDQLQIISLQFLARPHVDA